jgi:hypothetical protein
MINQQQLPTMTRQRSNDSGHQKKDDDNDRISTQRENQNESSLENNTSFDNTRLPELYPNDYDVSLINLRTDYIDSKICDLVGDKNNYQAHVELINILKETNSPLYMFDNIMQWAIRCNSKLNVEFTKNSILTREVLVDKIKTQFDVKKIEPKTILTNLPGAKTNTKIVCHDFKMCLYSLLSDKNLMKEENLLFDPDNIFTMPKFYKANIFEDIHTGSVYQKAYNKIIQDPTKELLCPIIFFIDKTHTDRNGRLCLEQIRFTLGIFNRATRNNANAWRTLGYINDQNQIPSAVPLDKVKDYQEMIRVILASYRETQHQAVGWNLLYNDKNYEVFFRLPVLFIIGDTDGHDKLCGRFCSRMNVARLCRYCDCKFDETDNPFVKFLYTQQKTAEALIRKNDHDGLREMTMHCVKNAWHEVLWCDPKRGIHGGTCAETMHCLQHGLFQYTLTQLYGQRKEKKKRGKRHNKKTSKHANKRRKQNPEKRLKDDQDSSVCSSDSETEIADEENYYCPEDSENYSRNKVFSQKYCKRFDKIARQYGKYLSRQSDRDLPRTHFFSNYTSVSCKNASEMSGVLLVFLIIFSTTEGNVIDKELGNDRSSAFLHVLELMLMLETFCKAPQHKRNEVMILKQFMPRLLETFKITLNRSDGNGMKIIKFHLPLHFADDILRFGVMSNFDSALGESHHKSEAKKPALRTQRRKTNFEEQTAKRQIENTSIRLAYEYINDIPIEMKAVKNMENKCFSIEYIHDDHQLYWRDRKRKLHKCQWKDKNFQKNLTQECAMAVTQKHLNSPIRFFTQHNRHGNIFRGNPNYKDDESWYDWVYVDWGQSNVPAKIMLFLQIEKCDFTKRFQFGYGKIESPGSYVIGHTFAFNNVVRAHGISKLCDYGSILTYELPNRTHNPQLWVFNVESIADPCTAVPYNIDANPVEELEWIILKPKRNWYDIFVRYMNESVQDNATNS